MWVMDGDHSAAKAPDRVRIQSLISRDYRQSPSMPIRGRPGRGRVCRKAASTDPPGALDTIVPVFRRDPDQARVAVTSTPSTNSRIIGAVSVAPASSGNRQGRSGHQPGNRRGIESAASGFCTASSSILSASCRKAITARAARRRRSSSSARSRRAEGQWPQSPEHPASRSAGDRAR